LTVLVRRQEGRPGRHNICTCLHLGKAGTQQGCATYKDGKFWRCLLQRGQVGVEVGYGFDAAEIVFQGEMLVRGVGVFVR
jgi:hypothetical protein